MHASTALASPPSVAIADHAVEPDTPPAAGPPKRPAAVGALATSSHPDGLYPLLFAEMCERFGFFLLLSLFTLYLDEKLHWPTDRVFVVYGWFVGLMYAGSFFGGVLADWWLGSRLAVLLGALLLSTGYFCLSVGSAMLPLALGLLIAGDGLFKPNISTLVGRLYEPADPRRDEAFALFYMAINLGALGSPFVAEAMRSRFGWSAAFGAAGAAMVLAVGVLLAGWKKLAPADQWDRSDQPQASAVTATGPRSAASESDRLIALLLLCVVMIVFWLAMQQHGSTLILWARDHTDRTIPWLWLRRVLGRTEFPTVWLSSLPAVYVLVLSPALMRLWRILRKRNLEPSTPAKIALGLLVASTAFVVLAVGAAGMTHRVGLGWLLVGYMVVTSGELLASPMGQSVVSVLAPRRLASLMMGVWFGAVFLGNLSSGYVGALWTRWTHARFFLLIAGLLLVGASILALQLPRLRAALPNQRQA